MYSISTDSLVCTKLNNMLNYQLKEQVNSIINDQTQNPERWISALAIPFPHSARFIGVDNHVSTVMW